MIAEETATMTPMARALRMKEDARALRLSDPALYLETAREIAATIEQITPHTAQKGSSAAGVFKDDPFAEKMILPDGAYLIANDSASED
jgi:hypothetical protein